MPQYLSEEGFQQHKQELEELKLKRQEIARRLEEAKALGDRLVVGLNSDSSIKRLKGETRPVNPLDERATVLASLASVDWVLPFGDLAEENDTPLSLIL